MTPETQHKLDQAFRRLGVWVSPEGFKAFVDYLSKQGIEIGEKDA